MLQPEPMFERRFLLIILFSLSCLIANAATFTVTSNADSGPGTLRQALLDAAANGSAEKDYIVFNIADQSEAGRTITIGAAALPWLSSNLVIDAATQPGNKLGRSDAKVTLQPANSANLYNAFVAVDIDSFEMYGMYIRDFRGSLSHGSYHSP